MRLSLNWILVALAALILNTGCMTGKSTDATEEEILSADTQNAAATEDSDSADVSEAPLPAVVETSAADATADAPSNIETGATAPAVAEEAPKPEETTELVDTDNSANPAPSAVVEPTPAAATITASTTKTGDVYVVLPGDTLGSIAQKIYGTPDRWRELAQANNLVNANRIMPGDKIGYDGTNAKTAAVKAKTHIVKKNETLFSIAKTLYGSGNYWPVIWRMNESAIPNPDTIAPGTSLTYDSSLHTAH